MLSETQARQRLRLHDGEQPIIALQPSTGGCWAQLFLTLGLYSFWRAKTVFALTDQRVIYKKGIISKTERSVPLTQIQDATVFSQFWVGGVRLSTAGGAMSIERLTPITPAEARLLADQILQEAHKRRASAFVAGFPPPPPHAAPPPLTIPEQIAELAKLRDQGIILQ